MATDTRSIAIALPCTLKDKLCRKTRQASSAETTRRRARRGFQPTLPRTRCGARNDARHALTITSQCARDETATHAHASRGGGGLMNAPAPNPHTDHCAGRCKCRRRHSAGDDQVLQYPKAKHCGVSRAQGTELHGETIQMSQPPPANRWSNPWRARFRRVGSDSASEHAPWD